MNQDELLYQLQGLMYQIAYGPVGVSTVKEVFRSESGDVQISFTTTIRDGATPDMIQETKRHYLFAAKCAARGIHTIENAEDIEIYGTRTDYGDNYHGQPRVLIFGDHELYLGWTEPPTRVRVSMNKFTEVMTAQDMLNILFLNASNAKYANAPVAQHAVAPAQNATTPQQAVTTTAPQAVGTSEYITKEGEKVPVLHFNAESFPGNESQRIAFGLAYQGHFVSFDMVKAGISFSQRDGAKQRTFFTNTNFTYPAMYCTHEGQYAVDAASVEPLLAIDGDANTRVMGKWRVIAQVRYNADKKRVYYNVKNVTQLEAPVQPATPANPQQAPMFQAPVQQSKDRPDWGQDTPPTQAPPQFAPVQPGSPDDVQM